MQTVLAWLDLFKAPFLNAEMLWIIIPVYIGWFFAEFFQEKRGTSLGNAISNGTIALWVGADWARTTFRIRAEQALTVNWVFFAKLFLAAIMFSYGLFIIIQGIKAKKVTQFIGRIRVVTYVILMATPLFYGVIKPERYMHSLIAIVILFPVYYLAIELLDLIIPDAAAIKEDMSKTTSETSGDNFSLGTDLNLDSGFENSKKLDNYGQSQFSRPFVNQPQQQYPQQTQQRYTQQPRQQYNPNMPRYPPRQ